MLHILQWLYMYASNVCSNCFIYFRHVLSVFHLDITKVDLNVAYTCMLQAYVSNVCFKGFIWMLHIFCNGYTYFFRCFRRMLQMFQLFRRCILQVFDLNIAKVDRGVVYVALGPICCSCKGIVHARGKWRDRARRGDGREKWRGMAVGARVVPACACSRVRAWAVTAYACSRVRAWAVPACACSRA
jgi:hypothetical protein